MNSSIWKTRVVKMNPEEQTDGQPREIWRAFWRVNTYLRKRAHKTATDNRLSLPQFFLLVMLGPLESPTQKQLGQMTRLPKSTRSQPEDGPAQAGISHRP